MSAQQTETVRIDRVAARTDFAFIGKHSPIAVNHNNGQVESVRTRWFVLQVIVGGNHLLPRSQDSRALRPVPDSKKCVGGSGSTSVCRSTPAHAFPEAAALWDFQQRCSLDLAIKTIHRRVVLNATGQGFDEFL